MPNFFEPSIDMRGVMKIFRLKEKDANNDIDGTQTHLKVHPKRVFSTSHTLVTIFL